MIESLLNVYHCPNKIRIGPKSDGGYIVDSNNLSEQLISAGCNNETLFESEYLKILPNSKIQIYDQGGRCDLSNRDSRVNFTKKYIKSIEDLDIKDDCVLAIDIESHEIDLIQESDIESLSRIKQLLIEFHFWDNPEESKIEDIFIKLNKVFTLIHIHGNNNRNTFYQNNIPQVIELTYVNKKNCDYNQLETANLPIPDLDFPNNPRREDIKLEWVNKS